MNNTSSNPFICLILGPSGSGKSTVTDKLAERGYSAIASYTTRLPRSSDEKNHTFVSTKKFPPDKERVAYTVFDGHQYCATVQQVEENDLYVVDPAGLLTFFSRYHGKKQVVVIGILSSSEQCKSRMFQRGDREVDVFRRIKNDEAMFASSKAHFWIENNDLDQCVNEIDRILTLVRNKQVTPYSTGYDKLRPAPKTVFIAGQITGDPMYREKFLGAETLLMMNGHSDRIIMNPTCLPDHGFEAQAYYPITVAMLQACDAAVFLPGWEKSTGANLEKVTAEKSEKLCYFPEQTVTALNAETRTLQNCSFLPTWLAHTMWRTALVSNKEDKDA